MKTILIDLDGVLNEYTGNFDANHIPKIREGAAEFIKKLSKEYEIKLFTTRNKILASKWLAQSDLDGHVADITNIKELAWLYIDDRCLQFNGDYEKTYQSIKEFKPWYVN